MNVEYLIEKYSKLIYKICFDMLNSPLDAQDMTQEVYISLYKNFNRYGDLPENEIKNIMCKIALNKCKDLLKSKIRKLEILADEEIIKLDNYISDTSIDDEVIKKDKSNYIMKTINKLKEPYGTLLYNYYIEERSLDEIARIRGSTKGVIKVQMHRAREKLKEELNKIGGENLL